MIKLYGSLTKSLSKLPKTGELDLDLSDCTTKDNTINTTLFPVNMQNRIVSMILPDSIEEIVDMIFENLKKISGRNVLKIYEYAFYKCLRLTSIDFPNVTRIGDYAFEKCKSLESIDLPKMHEVNEDVFKNCDSLKTINLYNAYQIEDFMPGVCGELFD